jgi:hypothetical protein
MRLGITALLRAAAVVVAVPLLASGCAGAEPVEYLPARTVVADFFDLLESGETGAVAALLSDDSALSSDVLDSDFYAAAVARPTGAEVVDAVETDPGVVVVFVDYSIDGEDRSMKVMVDETEGGAVIDGWIFETLSIDPLRAPGGFEVNGSLQVGELEESTQFVALPGVYTFEYVDPQGFGTIDPDGKEVDRSFELEFPRDADRLEASVPDGVTARTSSIAVEPRLLTSVEDSVDRQLTAMIAECTASALLGPSCPADIVSVAGRGGAVDIGSIDWTEKSAERSVPAEQWGYVADYGVRFSSTDGTLRPTVTTRFDAVILGDALGDPVLDLVR